MLEDRSRHRGNLSSAVVTRIHRTPIDAVVFAVLLALLAVDDPAGETLLFQVLKASGVIRELAVKVVDRVPEMLRNCLSLIHGKDSVSQILRDVKGYLPRNYMILPKLMSMREIYCPGACPIQVFPHAIV